MKVTTWNINGVKARLESALAYLRQASPEVICLQEIKSLTEAFPKEAFEDLGYQCAVHGQKGFNGVAILSKLPLEEVRTGLAGNDEDEQSRFIEAIVSVPSGVVKVASIYAPNGNPVATEKFPYKLDWLQRLHTHFRELLAEEIPFVMAGDYNIIPEPIDAKRPSAWTSDALFQPESRAAYRRMLSDGLTDAIRLCHPGPGVYTFWDYQAGAFQKDDGIRIDHLLLSPQATDRLRAAGVDRFTRGWEKPSDHVPAWVELDL
ncbi:MAG TPA: exodeoxyribonuclease III [Hyphomicrobium sp.]|nr:exodeoxyribonuclease III [Hyphomicrobium sp.]